MGAFEAYEMFWARQELLEATPTSGHVAVLLKLPLSLSLPDP